MFIFILFYANQNCWDRFWAPAHMVCERGFLEASWKRRWRCPWRVDAGWPTTPSTMLQRRLRTNALAAGRPVDCARLSRLGRTFAVVRPRCLWLGARHLGRAFAVVRPWWRLLECGFNPGIIFEAMPVSLRYQALSRSSWSDVRTQVGPSWYRNRSNYGGKLSQAFRREGGLCWAINKAIYAEDIMKVANARAIKKADYVGPSRRRPGGLCWGHNEGGQCQGHHEDGLCWTIKNAVYKGNI